MNEDILYQQYLSNNTESPISIEEFTSLKSMMSPEDFDNFVGLKKKKILRKHQAVHQAYECKTDSNYVNI